LVWQSIPHAAHRLRVDQVYLADALARGTLRDLRAGIESLGHVILR
jgi:hypothetical protein